MCYLLLEAELKVARSHSFSLPGVFHSNFEQFYLFELLLSFVLFQVLAYPCFLYQCHAAVSISLMLFATRRQAHAFLALVVQALSFSQPL